MLVVTRRVGQSIIIGDDIEVFVCDVDGSNVRIGIEAPRSVRVMRNELTEPRNRDTTARRFAAHRKPHKKRAA